MEGLYVADQQDDTLLYAGEARFRITDWFILKGGIPVIKYVGLHNAYANMYRLPTGEDWNYQFIADAFKTDKPKDSANVLEFDLREIDLSDVRFGMNDAWVGSDMNFTVGRFHINTDKVDIANNKIAIDDILAENTYVMFRNYEGGRPPKPPKPKTVDNTPFNPDRWGISANIISLKDCYFSYDNGTDPPTNAEFDPNHISINKIQFNAEDVVINADTLTAKLNNLTALERSGFIVRKLEADVRVSPTESICRNLLLKTNNSTLRDFYAMYYDRFPDFNHYIDSVIMIGNFVSSRVDSRDIAYFAPQLREYPTIVNISGKVSGAVSDIKGRNLNITDGQSSIKGNLSMEGLPNISNTYIIYTNGELITSGNGIIRYAKELADNETVNLKVIDRAYFKGDFKGYIDNFALAGTLNTNLGNVVSDVEMQISQGPQKLTTYSGKVEIDNFDIGTLLYDPNIGSISLNADVNGTESKVAGASVNFKAAIDKIDYNGYSYSNINADGNLEKKKFTGELIVADPNLAMGFYGLFDFSSKRLKINAKANVLYSNLTALNFVQADSMTLAADFDMDWEGVSIDDFTGYAKLYNIDLTRDNHDLDIDSVYVNAAEATDGRSMAIYSNAFDAVLKGEYVLSTLHNSFQYYLSGYLPNYIKKPDGEAPLQNFTFTLETHDLDSLFGILAPSLAGFNNAKVEGYLNTNRQKLELNAQIPYGQVNDITFRSTEIKSSGDFNSFSVQADVGRVYFEDTTMNGKISVATTLGNDRLKFKIATTSPYSVGDAVIEGQAVAYGDTLDANLLPSEFYLNENKWQIPAGNNIIYTDGYLSIRGVVMQSGNRSVRIESSNKGLDQRIQIVANNLSGSEIGKLAGLSEFDIKGKVNGKVNIDNLFTNVMVGTEITATGVEFGGDTVGTIILSGAYDGKKHLVNLNPNTGIHYGERSLTASGKISFDSTFTENIDGSISLNGAQLSWIEPILKGYVSDIGGTLDGKIFIKGTSSRPVINGAVAMNSAGVHIDFLGTYYKIPRANFSIDERKINLGTIRVNDAYNNNASLSGTITHNHFNQFALNLSATSDKFEVINLNPSASALFYGNLVASFESLTVRGPVDDISLRINNAKPAQKSHLFLQTSASSEQTGAYSYISFIDEKDEVQEEPVNSGKLSIHIDAILNPLAEITLVMDPSTGDAINAKGSGNISMDIPPNDDIRMYGRYVIDDGSYTFTLPQLFFKRNFILNSGSVITFEGPISYTQLNVDGIYKTRARLYDLLTTKEKNVIESLADTRETTYAKVATDINVILTMKGSLATPDLSFEIELPDKSGSGTIAYSKLQRINQDERELFNQVASLLLVNTFIPAEGTIEGGAASGVVNNVSDIFSGTASSQLTNLLTKLTGDDDIAVNLKYQKYNYQDNTGIGAGNRNAFSLQVKKNLFKDRLSIEVGSSIDWGKPTSANNASTFNPVGDFRLQYLIREGGNLRGNIFRTSSYDVLADQNITRGGVGLSWRRSFNTLGELFRGSGYMRKEDEEDIEEVKKENN